MRIDWRDALRHGLEVVALCCVIAVFTTLIWPRHHYGFQLAQSLLIGLPTWLVIEFGRYLVAPAHRHESPHGGAGWPKELSTSTTKGTERNAASTRSATARRVSGSGP